MQVLPLGVRHGFIGHRDEDHAVLLEQPPQVPEELPGVGHVLHDFHADDDIVAPAGIERTGICHDQFRFQTQPVQVLSSVADVGRRHVYPSNVPSLNGLDEVPGHAAGLGANLQHRIAGADVLQGEPCPGEPPVDVLVGSEPAIVGPGVGLPFVKVGVLFGRGHPPTLPDLSQCWHRSLLTAKRDHGIPIVPPGNLDS